MVSCEVKLTAFNPQIEIQLVESVGFGEAYDFFSKGSLEMEDLLRKLSFWNKNLGIETTQTAHNSTSLSLFPSWTRSCLSQPWLQKITSWRVAELPRKVLS